MKDYKISSTSATQGSILQILRRHQDVVVNGLTEEHIDVSIQSDNDLKSYQQLVNEIHQELDLPQPPLRD